MFLVYSLLFTLGLLLAAPYYLWRLRGNLISGAGWRERFGFLPQSIGDGGHGGAGDAGGVAGAGSEGGGPTLDSRDAPGAIWIHAVSVGETLAVIGLVRELQRRYPGRPIYMSCVTPAGRKAGEDKLPSKSSRPSGPSQPSQPEATAPATDQAAPAGPPQEGGRDESHDGRPDQSPSSAPPLLAGRFFLPLDWAWSARRVVRRIRPALLVIVETELWPNLLRAAHQSGARVVLVNARLSDRSFGGYKLARPFMRRVLANVDRICAQTPRDAGRFEQLGAPAGRITVTGNIKFDSRAPERGALPSILAPALAAAGRAPVMVAASTMPGEEPLLLEAWSEVRRAHPKALLILAPRHPARFESVAQLLARSGPGQGFSFVRRTALETANQELTRQLESPQILLLNTIGELAGVFALADVVFVGGSLVPTGGHNLLEPAFWSKPILFGPHMQNFRDIAALFLDADAAVQVERPADLARQALRILGDPALAARLGQAARRVLDAESGATQRILDRLNEELSSP
ncbi:MAG TPA: 3-deoxy-D-manno-octulosonic acid transferase [Terriglobia bacterium]|nr:3-deoxy-D-manno-octulosonic acid transferase [Terriglobia bacterium]